MIVLRRRAPLRGYADQGTTTRTWGGWSLILGGIAGLLTYAGTSKPRMGAAAGLGVLGGGLMVSAGVYYFKARELQQCSDRLGGGAPVPEGQRVVSVGAEGAVVCTDAGMLTPENLRMATWGAGSIGTVSLLAGLYLWKGKRR